MTMPNTSN